LKAYSPKQMRILVSKKYFFR